jgi:hypothetical protein
MAILPVKRDPVLLIHSNAVPACLIALKQFKAISGRHHEIIEATRCIKQPQLPLHDPPDGTRNSPSGTGISLTKQVGGCFVGERLNHTCTTRYTFSV